jgi:hypothetical protein
MISGDVSLPPDGRVAALIALVTADIKTTTVMRRCSPATAKTQPNPGFFLALVVVDASSGCILGKSV